MERTTMSPDVHMMYRGGEPISPPPSSGYYSPQSGSPISSSSACDVVKRGLLHVKKAPNRRSVRISIKTWQKKYLVLRDDWKDSGTTTLDIYDRECDAPGTNGKTTQGSIFFASKPDQVDLSYVTDVDRYLESRSFVHALIVSRSNGFPVILGAQSDLEMKGWMAAIKVLAEKARINRPPSCLSSTTTRDGKKPARGTSSFLSSRLNRSTPQLFKLVSGGGGGFGGGTFLHHSMDRQMSSSGNLTTTTTSDGSYIDVLEADSPRTPRTPHPSATLADYHSLKKILTNSFFSNIGSHKEAGSKWRPFSKMSRKDSGFSESFDESASSAGDQTPMNYCPPQDTVHEEDQTPSSSPPPVPPRRPSSPFSPAPQTPCHHEPWIVNAPPKPPPRPAHTLPHFGGSFR